MGHAVEGVGLPSNLLKNVHLRQKTVGQRQHPHSGEEALFLHGVDPHRQGAVLKAQHRHRLSGAVGAVLFPSGGEAQAAAVDLHLIGVVDLQLLVGGRGVLHRAEQLLVERTAVRSHGQRRGLGLGRVVETSGQLGPQRLPLAALLGRRRLGRCGTLETDHHHQTHQKAGHSQRQHGFFQ